MTKTNWKEIIENKYYNDNELEKAITEAYEKVEGYPSGYHIDVEIDKDGNIHLTDVLSVSWQSGESWNGETYVVYSAEAWQAENEDERDYEIERFEQEAYKIIEKLLYML